MIDSDRMAIDFNTASPAFLMTAVKYYKTECLKMVREKINRLKEQESALTLHLNQYHNKRPVVIRLNEIQLEITKQEQKYNDLKMVYRFATHGETI